MHTRVRQWLTKDEKNDLYVPKAIKDKSGKCFDYVFVSLGGNDQLTTGCKEAGVANVTTRVTSVLKQVQYILSKVPIVPV